MSTERYAVVVAGATPGGLGAAVRAAREGHRTLLVAVNDHLGGMMAGGLSYTDTLTTKDRAPLLTAFFDAVRDHYRETYGRDSTQYEFSEDGHIFEPHVAEEIFESWVAAEPNLDVRRGLVPDAVTRVEDRTESVTFADGDGETLTVPAEVYVEATYEGDLLATAGVPYRVGRESRADYDEQFAGELYTGIRGDRFYPREAVGADDDSASMDRRGPLDVPEEKRNGDLDLIPHPAGLTEIFPGSTGRGDDAIQAYNYRLCLSRDPENRRHPDKPENYDRSEYLAVLDDVVEAGVRRYLLLRYLPNEKADMNSADLPGTNHDYPEADRERRREVARRHREYALGLLYFLQNDEAVPAETRAAAREWGLAEDEFVDTDNFPWQLYVREARRLDGRVTYTENDARHAPGLDRTPVNRDAVAVTEYPLDSHACHERRQRGSQPEGFFYASQVTRPGQLPYRALLPEGLDDLLVPVPLSATHVAYGTVRLEPTWLHVGEAAGHAAALAVESGTAPGTLDPDRLQRRLVESGVMTSFFNGFDMGSEASWVPAVQYLATKGFFGSYDARPTDPLDAETARVWASIAGSLATDEAYDSTAAARRLPEPGTETDPVTGEAFAARLDRTCAEADLDATADELAAPPTDEAISRGEACELVYALLDGAR